MFKKKVRQFPVPSRDVTTKLSLGGNNDVITELFLPRGSLVSEILAGDGKLVNLFFTVYCPFKTTERFKKLLRASYECVPYGFIWKKKGNHMRQFEGRTEYTVKKKVREFPVLSRDVTTKLSLGWNNDVITELFLPRGSLVSDIPAGDGKLGNLFLRCTDVRKTPAKETISRECGRGNICWQNSLAKSLTGRQTLFGQPLKVLSLEMDRTKSSLI
jgi:hypothetical protein